MPRNARVADLVGIANRFQGQWLGAAEAPGMGLLRWVHEGVDPASAPVLQVRDKGKLPVGQAVHWVIPGDGISLLDAVPLAPGTFEARVTEAGHLGEISLATLALTSVGGAQLVLTLSGMARQCLSVGALLRVRLQLEQIHVMPLRQC